MHGLIFFETVRGPFVLCGICLSTFSHDVVRILASPELITGGTPNCKTGQLILGGH